MNLFATRAHCSILAIAFFLSLCSSLPAYGAFYVVSDFGDDNDINNGTCTLREAIRAANTNAAVDACNAGSAVAVDQINLLAGTYTLDPAGGTGEDNAVNGDLDILGNLNIVGVSPRHTIVDGIAGQGTERVFDILPGSTVLLRDLTVRGGNELGPGGGGNIRIGAATVDLIEVVVSDASARHGGGIFSAGTLTLTRSSVQGNQTLPDAGDNSGHGGGIESVGPLLLLDSAVTDNHADDNGGGLWYSTNALTMYRSDVAGNTAGADGGGVYALFNCDIQYSLLDDNAATRGGGIFIAAPQCEVVQSAIVNNAAASQGGGIHAIQDTFVRRSTLAGNSAAEGGGVYSNTGMTLLDTLTIAGNTGGGGIFNALGINVEVVLLADNDGGNCLGAAPSAGAYNLDDANTCGFVDNPANDQPNFPNTDPLLGTLSDNGGPTPTFALLPGSPAINAVSSDIQSGCQNARDQRGAPRGRPRTVNADTTETFFCDIGSYELVAPFVVDSTLDETDDDPADDLCLTATGLCTLRAAVQQANATPGLDDIVLPAATIELSLAGRGEDAATTGDLDLTDAVVIRGAGRTQSIVDATQIDRVFHSFQPDDGTTAHPPPRQRVLRDLTITGGMLDGDDGAGIHTTLPLTLTRAGVSGNTAAAPDGDGAGIFCGDECWLEVRHSVIATNVGSSNGGGLLQTGEGTAVIERSILHGNTASIGGGGEAQRLRVRNSTVALNSSSSSAAFFAGQAVIEDSTIYANQASNDVGALFLLNRSVIRNSIVAGNTEEGGLPNNCPTGGNAAGIASLGYNLSDTDASDCSLTQATDQVNTQPLLGPLRGNGGPTPTFALLEGSPAVDRGDDGNCPATDQRGVTRPLDGDSDMTAGCDIGAYELADMDQDGVPDSADNCLLVANSGQLDTDADGFGNICDGDFNNDCLTNSSDLGIMRTNFFAVGNRVTDLSGDGVTNVVDLALLRGVFFSAPGPSGIANDCSAN